MKETTIRLQHPIIGVREFNEQHASNLMAMSNNGGWQYVDAEVTNDVNESDAADNHGNSGNSEAKAKPKSGRNSKGSKARK